MKYDHRYHAGNFSDLVKHAVFQDILLYMQQKPTPVHIVDTHAGFGGYSVNHLTYEANKGLGPLLEQSLSSAILKQYQNTIMPFVKGGLFPGSPFLAAILKRSDDPLWAFEKYAEPFQGVSEQLAGFEKTFPKQENGLQGLKGLLPPISKRALVLIDPPYERPEEYTELAEVMAICFQRFAQGTYIIWYPHSKRVGALAPIMQKSQLWGERVLTVDYTLSDQDGLEGLQGAGLLILNPPFVLRQRLIESRDDFFKLGLSLRVN